MLRETSTMLHQTQTPWPSGGFDDVVGEPGSLLRDAIEEALEIVKETVIQAVWEELEEIKAAGQHRTETGGLYEIGWRDGLQAAKDGVNRVAERRRQPSRDRDQRLQRG
jgi:hypothetical protein